MAKSSKPPLSSRMGKLRHWLRNNWMSVTGLIVSIVAVSISSHTAYMERDYRQRSQRPEMLISFYYNKKGSGYRFGNIGLGPATLEWFQILVDSDPVKDWDAMVNRLGLAGLYTFAVPTPVQRAGEMYEIFWAKPGSGDQKLRQQFTRIILKACYCSIFGECWIAENRGPDPKTVSTCQPYPKVLLAARVVRQSKRCSGSKKENLDGTISRGNRKRDRGRVAKQS
jgi:hypothetical protein